MTAGHALLIMWAAVGVVLIYRPIATLRQMWVLQRRLCWILTLKRVTTRRVWAGRRWPSRARAERDPNRYARAYTTAHRPLSARHIRRETIA